jgi:predicted ribosomally synthesized peptide with SipW-like signal peptide
VLGVGAAVTLAAWNASDFATGDFQAGTFAFEGSPDGTNYALHAAGAPATLAFDAADDLSPSTTTYAPYWLRLGAGTTSDATVTVTSAGTTGTVAGLTYGMTELAAGDTCNASASGQSLIPAGTTLDSVGGTSPTVSLVHGASSTDDGTAVQLCLAVTAGAGVTQGQAGGATWQFAAQSTN